jgi:hypothetical protein
MYTLEEKGKCVIIFAETKSVSATRRRFQTMFNKNPPAGNAIRKWYDQFWNTGSLLRKKRSLDEDNLLNKTLQISEMIQESPTTSIRKLASATEISRSSVQRILRKQLRLKAYKIQMLQELKEQDFPKRVQFCETLLNHLNMNNLIMSDEATFHLTGDVNKHNCRIWASENPHTFYEQQRDSPKVTVWCAVSKNKIYGPFFFGEPIVKSLHYVDMLQQFFSLS